ncbi:lysis system i-spanin subunit Rz [Comamonadaceae bacterium PP-2]
MKLAQWRIAAAVIAVLTALAWGAHRVDAAGYARGKAETQILWNAAQDRVDQATAKAFDDALVARDKAQRQATDLRLELEDINTRHQEEMTREKNAQDAFIAGVRAGRIRLSVPTRPAAGSGAGACQPALPAAAGSTGAATDEARTELDPATGADLVAITDSGDDAVRDLNACIDSYNAVQRALTQARQDWETQRQEAQ